MARQFNLIPPVCEQAEYHFFQRDKVETQLPELYHKIGKCSGLFLRWGRGDFVSYCSVVIFLSQVWVWFLGLHLPVE